LAPGYQSFTYAGRRKPPLDFLSNSRGLFMARLKVGGNRALVAQVVGDHGSKQPFGRLWPRCIVSARGLNSPFGAHQSPHLDSDYDHA